MDTSTPSWKVPRTPSTSTRQDNTAAMEAWREAAQLSRLEDTRELVRLAAASERGVVALATERAELYPEFTLRRAEADGFIEHARTTCSALTLAAVERHELAEIAYEAQRRRAALSISISGDGSRPGSPPRSPHSPKSPKSPKSGRPKSPWSRDFPDEVEDGPFAAFVTPFALFAQLKPSTNSGGLAPVRLLRSEWIAQRAQRFRAAKTDAQRAAFTLPRRQQLEKLDPSAFYTAEEVEMLPRGNEYGSARTRHLLHIVCVSHVWRTKAHADPNGEVLLMIADALQRASSACTKDAEGNDYRKLPERVAVYFDWCSLCQPAEEKAIPATPAAFGGKGVIVAKRTEEERKAYHAALEGSHLWFGHVSTTVLLLDHTSYDHHDRCWPCYERRLASLAKRDRGPEGWPLVIESTKNPDAPTPQPWMKPPPQAAGVRLPPLTNKAFREMLSSRTLTDERDRKRLIRLYELASNAVVSGAKELSFDATGWADPEIAQLMDWLANCDKLESLTIAFDTALADEGVLALCDAAFGATPFLQKLKRLSIRWPKGGPSTPKQTEGQQESLHALTSLIESGHLPRLTRLDVPIRGNGAASLVQACAAREIRCDTRLHIPSSAHTQHARTAYGYTAGTPRSASHRKFLSRTAPPGSGPATPFGSTKKLQRSVRIAKDASPIRSLRRTMVFPSTITGTPRVIPLREAWRPGGGVTGAARSLLGSPVSISRTM